MKHFLSLSILLLTFFFLLPPTAGAGDRTIKRIKDMQHSSGKLGSYKALLIGINKYKDPKIPQLETAVNDARAMDTLLREQFGFKTTLLLDKQAGRAAIYKALRGLATDSGPGDSVLIYYAGHGELDRVLDGGWWIPQDAALDDPATYLDNTLVRKVMASMRARHVLLISDSCFSGSLFGKSRSLPPRITEKYYLRLYNDKSRWGLTSGSNTPVSDNGSNGHSVFAWQLLRRNRGQTPFNGQNGLKITIADRPR